MDAVERCPRLASLNGCSQIKQIMAGGVHVVDIDGKELAFVVGPLLPRSASTLTMLSMRSDGFASAVRGRIVASAPPWRALAHFESDIAMPLTFGPWLIRCSSPCQIEQDGP